MTRTAIITIAHGRHDHLAWQRQALLRCEPWPDRHIVVAIDDPVLASWRPEGELRPEVVAVDAAPAGLPLALARNTGAAAALAGGAELLVFLDVDCLPDPVLPAAYAAAAQQHPDTLLCGPVAYLPPAPAGGYRLEDLAGSAEPHPARPAPGPGDVRLDPDGHELFWSLSFALTATTWAAIGEFDEAYVGYGGEDTDFGQRARRAGIAMAWVGGARAFHQHHPVSDPPVEHVHDIVRNGALYAARWGSWPMRGWLDAFVDRGLVVRRGDGYALAEPGGPRV